MESSRLTLRRVHPDQPPQVYALAALDGRGISPVPMAPGRPPNASQWDGERRTHIDPDSHAAWAFKNRRDGGSRHYQMFDPSWSTESHGWIQSQKMSEMLIDGRCKTDFGPPWKSLMYPLWVCSI